MPDFDYSHFKTLSRIFWWVNAFKHNLQQMLRLYVFTSNEWYLCWRSRIRSLAFGWCALHGLLESWRQPCFRYIANHCFFTNMFAWILWRRSLSKQTIFRNFLHVLHTRKHYGLLETFSDKWISKCCFFVWKFVFEYAATSAIESMQCCMS